MHYRTFEPSEILKPYVKFFWTLEDGDTSNPDVQKVLPDGCTELIFNYGNSFKRIYPGHEEIQPVSFVHGQIRNFIELAPRGKVGIVAARFYPSGLAPFIALPVSELNNLAVPTHDLFEHSAQAEEDIFAETSIEKKIGIVEAFLVRHLLRNGKPDFLVQHCVNRIMASKGNIGLKSLTKTIRISERHLERKFTIATGLTPKSLQRIARFQNILKLIDKKQFNSLADLSSELGYYDPAHFTKDFKQFTGSSPQKFFSANHTLSDYFTSE